jgi:hypothetical protein
MARRIDASEGLSRAVLHYNAAIADGCGGCGHGDRNTKAGFVARLFAQNRPTMRLSSHKTRKLGD